MTHDERAAALVGEVRAEMARQGMKASALSAATGIPPHTLSRRLSGASPLTVIELLCICQALETTLAVIAERASEVAA